jgi:hypothetical protein
MLPNAKSMVLAAALMAGTCAGAGAAVIGSQGFGDINGPSANGSPTGDINTATSFTIGEMVSSLSQDGIFDGMSTQDLGEIPFSSLVGNSMSFGNSVFGAFQSTEIAVGANEPGIVSFNVLGEWTPGTQGGLAGTGKRLASFTVSLTQTEVHDGSLSLSATFSATDTLVAVPEASTWAMMLAGFAGLGVAGSMASRKRAAAA